MGQPDEVLVFELKFLLAAVMFASHLCQIASHRRYWQGWLIKNEKRLLMMQAPKWQKPIRRRSMVSFHLWFWGYIQVLSRGLSRRGHRPVSALSKGTCGHRALLAFHRDGTFAIPDGNQMVFFVYRIFDDPKGAEAEADAMAKHAVDRNKHLMDSGIDCLLLHLDYRNNTGSFLSPDMFERFIQPRLHRIIDVAWRDGLYTMKHTDGNIMPISINL